MQIFSSILLLYCFNNIKERGDTPLFYYPVKTLIIKTIIAKLITIPTPKQNTVNITYNNPTIKLIRNTNTNSQHKIINT